MSEGQDAYRRCQEEMRKRAAEVCDERGKEEQDGYGLNRAAQNYYRARNAVRDLPIVMADDTKPYLNSKPKMLPCPFCGHAGDIESMPSVSQAAGTYEVFRGWCDACGYGLNWCNHEPDAVAAWNTRTTPARNTSQIGEG